MPESNMQIAPEQGQFMGLLLELMQAKTVVEIGTFTGYSALVMAQALPPDGKIICCDMSKEWTDIAQDYWRRAGLDQKIELRLAPALETLSELIVERGASSIDAVFIDADKSQYDLYYENALKLVRVGGLIMIDNVLWGGSVIEPDSQDADAVAISNLNRKLLQDDRVTLSALTIADGLTLLVKR